MPILYHAHPGELAELPDAQFTLRRYGFRGVVQPLAADLYAESWDSTAVRAEIADTRRRIGPAAQLWIATGITNRRPYPERYTLWPWDDADHWRELCNRVRDVSLGCLEAAASFGLDSEFIPPEGGISQAKAWLGSVLLAKQRGAEFAAACGAVPLANATIDFMLRKEQKTSEGHPAYNRFWKGARPGTVFAYDTMYQGQPEALAHRLRKRWPSVTRVVCGWMLRATDTVNDLRRFRFEASSDVVLFSEDQRWLAGDGRSQQWTRLAFGR